MLSVTVLITVNVYIVYKEVHTTTVIVSKSILKVSKVRTYDSCSKCLHRYLHLNMFCNDKLFN